MIIAFISFVLGIFGLAGAIETNTNPSVSLVLLFIGLVLIRKEVKREESNSNSDGSINRPNFLP